MTLMRILAILKPDKSSGDVLVVHHHSDLIYWWVVWSYGFVCAAITRIAGSPISVDNEKLVYFFPHAWLGVSFTALTALVLVATNAKARGVLSLVVVLVLGILSWLIGALFGWTHILELLPLLRIHMNLAFYVVFSGTLLLFWMLVVFGTERLTVWRFTPGSISIRTGLMDEEKVYKASSAVINRVPDDVFVHKILGLWIIGYGTGDIEISFNTPSGRERHMLRNVWRANEVTAKISKLLSQQQVTAD